MLAMRGGLALGNVAAGLAVTRFGIQSFFLVSGLLAIVAQTANYFFCRKGE